MHNSPVLNRMVNWLWHFFFGFKTVRFSWENNINAWPLVNTSKSHHLAIGAFSIFNLPYRKSLKAKQCRINDLGITLCSAFTPSANVLTAGNKVGAILYFIKRSFICLTKAIFVLLCSALVRQRLEHVIQANFPYFKKDIYHLERTKRAATSCVNVQRCLTYEERLPSKKGGQEMIWSWPARFYWTK